VTWAARASLAGVSNLTPVSKQQVRGSVLSERPQNRAQRGVEAPGFGGDAVVFGWDSKWRWPSRFVYPWTMATLPNAQASQQHWEVIERGEHLFQQLLTRDLPSSDGHLVIEMDIRPELSNVRGALQGGLIAVLVDMCAGRLAYQTCDHENGFSTATSDLNVHFLSPVTVGPARAEARIIRSGKSSIVLQVDVTDVGREKLAAVSTIAFTILAPRS
jgi:uncharacterized protein (TIGR00369 family)